jgi:hypothetical protein
MQWAEQLKISLGRARRMGKAYSGASQVRNSWCRLRTRARSLDNALGKWFYAMCSMSDDQ